MEKKNLMNSPQQLYNCSETFVPLDFTPEKAGTLKNTKYVHAQAQGKTDLITVLCAASAAGLPLPPFIIYPKSFPAGSYVQSWWPRRRILQEEPIWVDSLLAWMMRYF